VPEGEAIMTRIDRVVLNQAFVVTRIIPALAPAAELNLIAEVLQALPGLGHAELDGRGRLVVRYDASQVGFHQIEHVLDQAGIMRPTTLWWRVRAEWYRFTDSNARANAHATHACCSRPPVAPGSPGKKND
jgi:hypothetical protein